MNLKQAVLRSYQIMYFLGSYLKLSVIIPHLNCRIQHFNKNRSRYRSLMAALIYCLTITFARVKTRLWQIPVSGSLNSLSQIVFIFCKSPVMLGERDIVKPEAGIKMHRSIKNSQFCILPNTTHFMFAEKPDLISRLAIDFLK